MESRTVQLILVEGLPGTGKTTLAEQLCAFATSTGQYAVWHREEEQDHPVHPLSLTTSREQPGFASRCLQNWRAFAERSQPTRGLCILEGSAFQSTVRFLMEQEHGDARGYIANFEHVVKTISPVLVYLRPSDATSHSHRIAIHRGENWSSKVSRYLQKTPYAIERTLQGMEGMHQFWSDYAELCDGLYEQMSMPKIFIPVAPPELGSAFQRSVDFLERTGHLTARAPSSDRP